MDIIQRILEELGDNVLSIILFGSCARFGKGKDVDLIVIIKDYDKKLEKELRKKYKVDLHLMTLEDFLENIKYGFLKTIILGYKILYDKINIKEKIKEAQKEIRGKYIDKYGEWDLNKIKNIL